MTHEQQPPNAHNQQPLQIYEQRLDLRNPGDAVVALHEMGMLTGELHRQLPDSDRQEAIDELLAYAEGLFGRLELEAGDAAGYSFATGSFGKDTETARFEAHPGVPGAVHPITARNHAEALRYADLLSCAAKLLSRLLDFRQVDSPFDIHKANLRLAGVLESHCQSIYRQGVEKLSGTEAYSFRTAVLRRLLESDDPRDKALCVALDRNIHRMSIAERLEDE